MKPKEPRNQHTVSQVLLRRFTDSTGTLGVFDLKTSKERRSSTADVGFVRGFIQIHAATSEAEWAQTESQMGAVFDAIDTGVIFERETELANLRRFMAIHWARSRTFLEIYLSSKEARMRDRMRRMFKTHPELDQIFLETTGLYPAGPEARMIAVEKVYEAVERNLDKSAFFRERVHENVAIAQRRLESFELQIAFAHEGQFLISDNPMITARRGEEQVGVLGGIPWDDAEAIVFPLGLRNCASPAPKGGWMALNQDGVDQLNMVQLKGAVRDVYFHPGSGLGSWAKEFTEAPERN